MFFTKIQNNKIKKYKISVPGRHVFFFFNFSGDINIDIVCPSAHVYIYGVYIAEAGDKFSVRSVQHHVSQASRSDLFIKGIFFDDAEFEYRGLIKIEKKGGKSQAYQKNQNLIMSDKVKILSKPDLEILADDVRCTHGSTTGTLNKDQIYYLKTRGLSRRDSLKVLTNGFIGHVFDIMSNLGLSEVIKNEKQKCIDCLNVRYK